MRAITKRADPPALAQWKRSNPTKTKYEQLSDDVRRSIRKQALEEQFYLCAYCCCKINSMNADDCHNEHMESRKLNSMRELDYSNIVASCNTRNQCGNAHGSQVLPLLPVMHQCETELQFMISGRVRGLTQRASESIRVLNLGDSEINNKALVEKRRNIVQTILLKNGAGYGEEIEDEDIVRMLIADISAPHDGRLDSFAPVAVNVIRNWI
ncbi:MAG: hypothetical protein ACKN89_12805 [Cyanobium sp.]